MSFKFSIPCFVVKKLKAKFSELKLLFEYMNTQQPTNVGTHLDRREVVMDVCYI